MTKITAPAAGYNATSTYGNTTLLFQDGVAITDNLPDGVRQYLLQNGYTVDGEQVEQPAPPEPIDSRTLTEVQVGSSLRDGAVDPQPGDFLGPVNAGKGDPHGPDLVNPGIHAEGERIVRPGPVGGADQQDAAEKVHAEALLIDQKPVDQVDSLAGPDYLVREADGLVDDTNLGELGLSDPASVDVKDGDAAADQEPVDGAPKGNASRDDWVAYARAQGAPEEQLADDGSGLSRDELRAQYGA